MTKLRIPQRVAAADTTRDRFVIVCPTETGLPTAQSVAPKNGRQVFLGRLHHRGYIHCAALFCAIPAIFNSTSGVLACGPSIVCWGGGQFDRPSSSSVSTTRMQNVTTSLVLRGPSFILGLHSSRGVIHLGASFILGLLRSCSGFVGLVAFCRPCSAEHYA